jgi:nicotine oxidoreductase
VSNATLNRFFSLHYLLPFLLAALALAHLIALHVHGSNNPNGIGANGDRYPMHPYYIFKLRRFGFITHPQFLYNRIAELEQGRLCAKESWTVYLGTWGNSLLNRACAQKVLVVLKQIGTIWSVQLDMVRATLPKFQFPFHPHVGVYLICAEIYQSRFKAAFEGFKYALRLGSFTKGKIKEMSGEPKSKRSRSVANSGSAKASNSYADRGLGVAVKWFGTPNGVRSTYLTPYHSTGTWKGMSLRSSPVFTILRQHSTGTGSSTNVLSRLRDLHNLSQSNPNSPIDRKLYKSFILNKDMLLLAYNKLRSKPGLMTPGISPETLDGMSDAVISDMMNKLKSETFAFSPGRRIEINKASGRKRPLTIANPRDKLVQEVIRLVLEAIYEPIFKETSFGFRPQRSTHSALRYVFTKFKGCAWWIEGDIKGCFDNIPHDKLMNVLYLKIKDQRFLQLVRKALNAGYMMDNIPVYDIVGTPQGSIVSPILANIYLHQLDQFVEDIKLEFDQSKNRQRQPIVRQLQWLITKYKRVGDDYTVRKLAVQMRNYPNKLIGSGNRKVMYVRYADDWVIAVNGSLQDTQDILSRVTIFLKELGLTVSPTKTKITNTYKDRVLFLGTNISHSKNVTYSYHKGRLQRNSGFLILSTPMDRIYKKLLESGFMSNKRGRSRVTWMSLEIRQIIYLANSVIMGFENYYSFTLNKGSICSFVYYIIKDVVLRTLAAKLSLKTRAKVIKRFGSNISLFDHNKRDKDNKPTLIAQLYKPSYRINIWDFKSKINPNIMAMFNNHKSLARLDNLVCSECGSEYKVEMHHIREMKYLKQKMGSLDFLMARRNRKQIPVCRICHMKYHGRKGSDA